MAIAKSYKIELTDRQLNFLLWTFGYILAESDNMNEIHKFYIQENHDAIIHKLIGARAE